MLFLGTIFVNYIRIYSILNTINYYAYTKLLDIHEEEDKHFIKVLVTYAKIVGM